MVTTLPYISFLLIDFFIKVYFGLSYLWSTSESHSGIGLLQDASQVGQAVYAAFIFVTLTALALIYHILFYRDSSNIVGVLLTKYLSVSLVALRTVLIVPTQLVSI